MLEIDSNGMTSIDVYVRFAPFPPFPSARFHGFEDDGTPTDMIHFGLMVKPQGMGDFWGNFFCLGNLWSSLGLYAIQRSSRQLHGQRDSMVGIDVGRILDSTTSMVRMYRSVHSDRSEQNLVVGRWA